MKFKLQTYEKLIGLVRENPCLYDSSSEHYKDVRTLRNTWRKIAAEMNDSRMSWEDWKKLWKQKRDAFTRKRKEMQDSLDSTSDQPPRKLPPLFKHMRFLVDHVQSMSTPEVKVENAEEEEDFPLSSNVSHEDDMDDDHDDAPATRPLPSTRAAEEFTQRQPSPPSQRHDYPTISEPTSNRISNVGSSEREEDPRLIQALEHLNTNLAHNSEVIKRAVARLLDFQDGDGNMLVFLSRKLKEFSPETQNWVEDEVLKIYMEAKKRERSRPTETLTVLNL